MYLSVPYLCTLFVSFRCSTCRAYRMPATAMINITHGGRKTNTHANQHPLQSMNGITPQGQQSTARGSYAFPNNRRPESVILSHCYRNNIVLKCAVYKVCTICLKAKLGIFWIIIAVFDYDSWICLMRGHWGLIRRRDFYYWDQLTGVERSWSGMLYRVTRGSAWWQRTAIVNCGKVLIKLVVWGFNLKQNIVIFYTELHEAVP